MAIIKDSEVIKKTLSDIPVKFFDNYTVSPSIKEVSGGTSYSYKLSDVLATGVKFTTDMEHQISTKSLLVNLTIDIPNEFLEIENAIVLNSKINAIINTGESPEDILASLSILFAGIKDAK